MEPLDEPFWQVFHESRNPMLLFDERRRYRHVNDAACECFGRPRAQLLRRRVGDLAPGDLQRRLESVYPAFLQRGRVALPWSILRPDGERRELFLLGLANAVEDLHLLVLLNAPPRLPAGGLTPREREIAGLLAAGCDGPQIAQRLDLAPETVRTHIRNAMTRSGARTRAHLIAIAVRDRLIDV